MEKQIYLLFNNIPKSIRYLVSLTLLIIGFTIQFEVSIILGSIFIIMASLLNIMRSAKIKERKIIKSDWQRVTFQEFYKIQDKIEKIKKWEGLPASVKFVILFFIIIFLFKLPPVLKKIFAEENFLFLFLFNIAILFIPLLFSGNKSAWIPKDIDIKISALLKIMNFQFIKGRADIRIQPYLLVGKLLQDKNMPLDVKLMIELPKAPKDFIGIQIQATINNVGNKAYPYVYAVIIAKESLNIKVNKLSSGDKNIVLEPGKENEMNILVIRQRTTKTSGYHTNDVAIFNIVKQSLDIASQNFAF